MELFLVVLKLPTSQGKGFLTNFNLTKAAFSEKGNMMWWRNKKWADHGIIMKEKSSIKLLYLEKNGVGGFFKCSYNLQTCLTYWQSVWLTNEPICRPSSPTPGKRPQFISKLCFESGHPWGDQLKSIPCVSAWHQLFIFFTKHFSAKITLRYLRYMLILIH